jgi:hypothetical protein
MNLWDCILGIAYCKKFEHCVQSNPNDSIYLGEAMKAFENALRLYKDTDQKEKYYNVLIGYSLPISGLAMLGRLWTIPQRHP